MAPSVTLEEARRIMNPLAYQWSNPRRSGACTKINACALPLGREKASPAISVTLRQFRLPFFFPSSPARDARTRLFGVCRSVGGSGEVYSSNPPKQTSFFSPRTQWRARTKRVCKKFTPLVIIPNYSIFLRYDVSSAVIITTKNYFPIISNFMIASSLQDVTNFFFSGESHE